MELIVYRSAKLQECTRKKGEFGSGARIVGGSWDIENKSATTLSNLKSSAEWDLVGLHSVSTSLQLLAIANLSIGPRIVRIVINKVSFVKTSSETQDKT
jgi:hypothetical protein